VRYVWPCWLFFSFCLTGALGHVSYGISGGFVFWSGGVFWGDL
jgi:hypothetical protein